MAFTVELWGAPHSKVDKGRKGLRSNRREGRAWGPGRDMLGGAWGRARRGGGLVTWVPGVPRELPCGAGLTACWQRLGDQAGRRTVEATPRELSETRSRCCREPWRRNLLVPPCATGRRGKEEDVLTRLMGVNP